MSVNWGLLPSHPQAESAIDTGEVDVGIASMHSVLMPQPPAGSDPAGLSLPLAPSTLIPTPPLEWLVPDTGLLSSLLDLAQAPPASWEMPTLLPWYVHAFPLVSPPPWPS